MNQLAENRELAHLFVQFAFSYEIQGRDVARTGYPIYGRILDELAQLDLSYLLSGDSETTLRWFTAEESAQAVEMIKSVHTPFTVEENVWEILLDAAQSYLKGEKTLDASLDELTSRLQLYLYE